MLKINKKASTVITVVLASLFMAALVCLYFMLPSLVPKMLDLKGYGDVSASVPLIAAYVILALATVSDLLVLMLAVSVLKGEVFTDGNVAILRRLSWCVILAAGPFALLTVWFTLSAAVGFVALFVGICLRVVKNAFEEAAAIKAENDFTI
jgi:hypothetical protein